MYAAYRQPLLSGVTKNSIVWLHDMKERPAPRLAKVGLSGFDPLDCTAFASVFSNIDILIELVSSRSHSSTESV